MPSPESSKAHNCCTDCLRAYDTFEDLAAHVREVATDYTLTAGVHIAILNLMYDLPAAFNSGKAIGCMQFILNGMLEKNVPEQDRMHIAKGLRQFYPFEFNLINLDLLRKYGDLSHYSMLVREAQS